ncbi:MAG: hypothetical protein HY657_15195 [Acidobacteria bacterium]|nr:hypothetical protein [Acidobacteriota bacterium]
MARSWAVVLAVSAGSVQAQVDLETVVARASAYVESFQRDFGLVVAEERYEQEVRTPTSPLLGPGRGPAPTPVRAVLRSDFLLVRTPQGWMPFRDVFERSGSPVRDREDRLAALFLNNSRSALEQARQIMEESARYNVGNINRNINLPTLALDFLTPAHRPRFDFTDAGREGSERILEFAERGRPTYIRTTADRDLPVTGRYWVDEATGRIQRTEMHASDPAVEAHIIVTYQADEGAGIWVPARMEERYLRRDDRSEIRGVATYSNFRRFRVTTTEELAP